MYNVRTNSELQVQDVPVGLFLRGNRIDMGGGGRYTDLYRMKTI